MIEDYFAIQVFFIILRETLETAIIVSVLLSFINQQFPTHKTVEEEGTSNSPGSNEIHKHHEDLKKKMKLQVWIGAVAGLTICLFIGLVFILAFYYIGKDYWSYTERLWEGIFSILSSLIITIMGLGLLRINKVMKVKWWMKLGDAYKLENTTKLMEQEEDEVVYDENLISQGTEISDASSAISIAESFDGMNDDRATTSFVNFTSPRRSGKGKHFLMILPLVTTLREGLEAVVFIGGSAMTNPPSSIPLSIILGISVGSIIGYCLYQGGNKLSLQYFLTLSTCFLYLVSAGLMSRGVWFLELEQFVQRCGGMDPTETGSGPGSYDITKSVWHVNCCNGLTDGWWMVFNAILGWSNSATYGSVLTYLIYWIVVIIWLNLKLCEEKYGYIPFLPIRWQIKRMKKKLRLLEYITKDHGLNGIEAAGESDSLLR